VFSSYRIFPRLYVYTYVAVLSYVNGGWGRCLCRKVYAWCWAIFMVCGAVEACCMNEEWCYLFMALGCVGKGRGLYMLYTWRGNIVHCWGRCLMVLRCVEQSTNLSYRYIWYTWAVAGGQVLMCRMPGSVYVGLARVCICRARVCICRIPGSVFVGCQGVNI
jgi:hypothetical protein